MADRIYVMNPGRMAERGVHAEQDQERKVATPRSDGTLL
jgi:ABC-type transport system involved in Fe-S cluster assembly fused permease/ATPase subunit